MQDLDGEIEKLFRSGVVDLDAALSHPRKPTELREALEKFG